jgi:uridine kinase
MEEKIDIDALVLSKQPDENNTLFIAVDGHGGSGKSTLAKWLAEKYKAEIIHTDDFASWDNPLNWWPLVIERVFGPIQKGAQTLSYPRSKWAENHNPEPVTNQPVTKIMVIEGVSSLRKEFRPYIGLGIFVDTPKDVCLKRGVERDAGTKQSQEEVVEMWNKWFAEEDKYIARDDPKSYADIVIDGTKSFEEQLTYYGNNKTNW